jgi:hypothetical protein
LQTALKVSYVYNYVRKLCGQQAEVIQNYENEHIRSIRQSEVGHIKYKMLKPSGDQTYDPSSDSAAIVA